VTFTYPYLENDEHGKVDLGGRLGFIYGSLAICAVIFAFFFVPETSHLELEEINHRFHDNKAASGRS
jgi:MFS transporter, SP family, sugar:H+ symporter